MLQFDPNQINKNLRGVAAANEVACGRSVKAMSLNAKDRTLDALAKYIDKPTPFTLRKGAFQASSPKKAGDDVVSTMTVAPIQSGAVRILRRDASSRRSRHEPEVHLAADVRRRVEGQVRGLAAGFVKKISLLIARNRKGKGASRYVHYGFAKSEKHGGGVGMWKYPGRMSIVSVVPVMKRGRQVMRKGKALTRKGKRWFDVGEAAKAAAVKEQQEVSARERDRLQGEIDSLAATLADADAEADADQDAKAAIPAAVARAWDRKRARMGVK